MADRVIAEHTSAFDPIVTKMGVALALSGGAKASGSHRIARSNRRCVSLLLPAQMKATFITASRDSIGCRGFPRCREGRVKANRKRVDDECKAVADLHAKGTAGV
jgi:hypothetical protein